MTWTVAQLNGNTRRDSWRLLPAAIWKFATRHFQQSKRRFRTFQYSTRQFSILSPQHDIFIYIIYIINHKITVDMKSRWSPVHGVPICWDRSLESLGGENLSRQNVASATSVMLRWPRAAESYGRCGSTGRAKSTQEVVYPDPTQKKSWEESRKRKLAYISNKTYGVFIGFSNITGYPKPVFSLTNNLDASCDDEMDASSTTTGLSTVAWLWDRERIVHR